MHIEQMVDVNAPVQRVWDVTVDLAAWPSWNPTVETVEVLDAGPMRTGLRARLRQPGNRPAMWTVTRVVEGEVYEWETRALGMVVTALHRFEPTSNGTHVILSIDVDGPTAPLLGWIVARVSRKFLPMEAAALKRVCESA